MQASEPELVPLLRKMKLKELERHAEKLAAKYGQSDYGALIRDIIRFIPTLGSDETDRFSAVQTKVREHLRLENDPGYSDALQRLTTVLMMIITRKFQKIHNR